MLFSIRWSVLTKLLQLEEEENFAVPSSDVDPGSKTLYPIRAQLILVTTSSYSYAFAH
jgi:hypothetical protein